MEYRHVASVLGKLRQEDQEFKTSLGYLVKPCFPSPKRSDYLH